MPLASTKHSSASLELVMQLMAIRGGSGQEKLVAEFVIDQLRRAGAAASAITIEPPPHDSPLDGQIGNVILKLPGTLRAPRRLLMAHLDTVPICVGCRPIRDGQMIRSADPATGLGADDRAGAAAILQAALHILQDRPAHPPLTFLWTVQEEIGLYGARNARVSLLGKPKLAFNWDGGSSQKLSIGATGGYRLAIDVRGRASHAGVAPEQGVSAIAIASLAIADLVRGGWHGDVRKGKRHGTSNIGVIQGGQATNVVTERVQLRAEARSHDPPFRERIVREIERSFERAAREVKNAAGQRGGVEFTGRLDYEAFRLADDEPCMLAAEGAIRAVGGEPLRAISNGGLDANWMTAHGIPTVTLGCGQVNAHTTGERLDIAEFERACRIAVLLSTGAATPGANRGV